MPKFKVVVDQKKCIGCGNCVAVCPDSFELIDGKSKPKQEVVDSLGCIKEAADSCPVKCIKVAKSK